MEAWLRREAIRLDGRFLEGITNRAQWERRRPELRREYFEMLGLWPLPPRTPLRAEVTGVIERPEGFRVEKIDFQSRPRLYVTGDLYLPQDAKAGDKLAAVLYVCGHSYRGRDGNKSAYQRHGIWFATHGYVCLIIDSLQLGEIAGVHHGTYRRNRWWWQAAGYTPAGVECWNGIRALDYLQSRPEVDPDRLAVTGISGGGAATFWIAAADERVKVAVPVSGMSDLEQYVGDKIVNGHCDCMFLVNTFQWPWTQIAALIAPRPLLVENSGHDRIFPMPGNERIRARLDQVYSFYTNRTDRLFDIGVVPGDHGDKVELRLMAYRWINRFLKANDSPVTEPPLPEFDGKQLRVFPHKLPADEINTKIDELFTLTASNPLPQNASDYPAWRDAKMRDLRRIVFRGLPEKFAKTPGLDLSGSAEKSGAFPLERGARISWRYFPARDSGHFSPLWVVIAGPADSIHAIPSWATNAVGNAAALIVAPRGSDPGRWSERAPYYIRRSLPLLGWTLDRCGLEDILAALAQISREANARPLRLIGRGAAGVTGAYAALFDPRVTEVALVNPPASHRYGPIFLNVLRVLDTPDALGMLAPRRLTIVTSQPRAFDRTAALYRAGGGSLRFVQAPAAAPQHVFGMPAPLFAAIPKLRGQIQFDGKLDEPVWKHAAVLAPFVLNDGRGAGSEPTEVRIWRDDDALYLGWICTDSDIEATLTKRDSHFWDEEVVEFFIAPNPSDLSHYFELQWNPLGGVFDAIITNHLNPEGVSTGTDGDWSYTAAGMKSAVQVIGTVSNPNDRDQLWSVEVRIPFSDLGHPAPQPGEIWRGNFYRFNRGKGHPVELLSWSPTLLPSFHQPARFGYLEFK